MKPVRVLLVEDDEMDRDLILDQLKEGRIHTEMEYAVDGEQALDILHQRGAFSESSRPDLILLDVNMPKLSGFDVLERVKSDQNLKSIPVVMLTSSQQEEDIAKSYGLGANCYIQKPIDSEKFVGLIRALGDFWLTFVKLPKNSVD